MVKHYSEKRGVIDGVFGLQNNVLNIHLQPIYAWHSFCQIKPPDIENAL